MNLYFLFRGNLFEFKSKVLRHQKLLVTAQKKKAKNNSARNAKEIQFKCTAWVRKHVQMHRDSQTVRMIILWDVSIAFDSGENQDMDNVKPTCTIVETDPLLCQGCSLQWYLATDKYQYLLYI